MFLLDVLAEVNNADAQHAPYHSHHEAYGVLLEEVEEYWTEVKKKRHLRDPAALYAELVQVAAVTLRIVRDLGLAGPQSLAALLESLAHSQGYGLIRPPNASSVPERSGNLGYGLIGHQGAAGVPERTGQGEYAHQPARHVPDAASVPECSSDDCPDRQYHPDPPVKPGDASVPERTGEAGYAHPARMAPDAEPLGTWQAARALDAMLDTHEDGTHPQKRLAWASLALDAMLDIHEKDGTESLNTTIHAPAEAEPQDDPVEETVLERLERLQREQGNPWDEAAWRQTLARHHIDPDTPAPNIWSVVQNLGLA